MKAGSVNDRPPPPPAPIRGTRTHCSYCGQELVETVEPHGYDVDGTPEMIRWLTCPRFWRSWRNAWMGGCHTSYAPDHGLLAREWR